MLHVYAILDSKPSSQDLNSLGISSLRLIEAGSLYVLVSEASLQTEPKELALAALEHNSLIEKALGFCSLLPARFTAPLEENMVVRTLKSNLEAYKTALDRVRNALEFALRAEVPVENFEPVTSDTSSGRAYLESRRKQFYQEHQSRNKLEAIAASLELRLGSLALEVLHRYEPNVYRGSYLVKRANLEVFKNAFQTAFKTFQTDTVQIGAVQLGLHGPFAPYSFAAIESSTTEGVI
jgi:Gas vesicle synthesis protein GvpL/GvpF